mmetsp:Transcript_1604/g.2224  ORF Transcript_1604/g.2224 Transcript_1604/m.2224 type:complete len:308 (-) Transcript_1604:40-963(-)
MKWRRHLFIFSLATSAQIVSSTFISSRRGTTNSNSKNPQIQPQTVVVSTAADAAIALNSIAFMNSLCRRKNTADVRTFTQSITSSIDHANHVRDHVHKNKNNIINNNSCIEKQTASKDEDNTPSLWTLLNVFFRTNEEPDCSEIMIPPKHNDNSSTVHNNPNTNLPQSNTHETVAEYLGKLWFLPKNKGTIKFRETIRILSLGLDGETSTVECHTQYYNGSEWVDCSKVICHFSSLLATNSAEYDASAGYSSSSSSLLLQEKVKMTLDCELLVWLPLPSVASKAVRTKIGTIFEEIVAEFFDELALA